THAALGGVDALCERGGVGGSFGDGGEQVEFNGGLKGKSVLISEERAENQLGTRLGRSSRRHVTLLADGELKNWFVLYPLLERVRKAFPDGPGELLRAQGAGILTLLQKNDEGDR